MAFNPPSREIKSVKTAFELIQIIQSYGGATPTQLTDELDLSKSSIHNYLSTLERMGYVVNEVGTYRLGLRFLTHGIAAKSSFSIESPVVDELVSVAAKLMMPVWWVAEEHGRGIFLEVSVPDGTNTIYGQVGKRSYLHTHAPGKSILSRLPNGYVEEIIEYQGLPSQSDQTTIDPEILHEELQAARNRGFAISQGGAALGIRSVGSGFVDHLGRVHALGVFGESRELTDTRAASIGEELMQACSTLETEFKQEAE